MLSGLRIIYNVPKKGNPLLCKSRFKSICLICHQNSYLRKRSIQLLHWTLLAFWWIFFLDIQYQTCSYSSSIEYTKMLRYADHKIPKVLYISNQKKRFEWRYQSFHVASTGSLYGKTFLHLCMKSLYIIWSKES